jgi:hypothetical protein
LQPGPTLIELTLAQALTAPGQHLPGDEYTRIARKEIVN